MRHAAEVSARAHIRAIKVCRPGLFEYHLETGLEYEFHGGGAKMPAYGSIVAAGHNVCVLHYRESDAAVKDGNLILIDAGCEIDCYINDITRTFPANDRFSPEQRTIYELVLEANTTAFDYIVLDRRWNEAHETTVWVITVGLVCLGLLRGDVDELIAHEAYRVFYIHRADHWLGMDVHDVGEYRVGDERRVLEPGMAMATEPDIYVAPDNISVARRWRSIGVCIGDDVVVTHNDYEVLTNGAPKAVVEIEALIAAAKDEVA